MKRILIALPIDVKSFYFNILNDNESGHTATVSTPIKQGSAINEKLSKVFEIRSGINRESEESLACRLLSNSRAKAAIRKVCVFDKLSVNGEEVLPQAAFCFYVREEIDTESVHCGRQKLHYPSSLRYEDAEICIDNRSVMEAISTRLHGYAYIVDSFEFDEIKEVLNFNVTIVGEHDIPYSKVFLNKKGVGNKFAVAFNDYADLYDSEIISLREHLGYDMVSPDNYIEVIGDNKRDAIQRLANYITYLGYHETRILADEYPYSLYDVESRLCDGKKHFYIVRTTSTKIRYFNLPSNKLRFCNDFPDQVSIALVSDINGEPKINIYSVQDINQMNKTISSVTFECRGDQ